MVRIWAGGAHLLSSPRLNRHFSILSNGCNVQNGSEGETDHSLPSSVGRKKRGAILPDTWLLTIKSTFMFIVQ